MKRKHIDAARETRLWIGQILIPAFTMGASLLAIPEVRGAISAKGEEIKAKIQHKIDKIKGA